MLVTKTIVHQKSDGIPYEKGLYKIPSTDEKIKDHWGKIIEGPTYQWVEKKDYHISEADIKSIAMVCHEANRKWCELHGEPQKPWIEAEPW